ncbi:MAG: hypothetical protein AAB834_02095 [Patescibacteria group bacterium]
MSVELGRGYVSDGLVELMAREHLGRREVSPDAKLGVLLCYPTEANCSYGLQNLHYGGKLTDPANADDLPPVELYIPTESGFELVRKPQELRDAKERGLYRPAEPEDTTQGDTLEALAHDRSIIEKIKELNERPDIRSILAVVRSATGQGDAEIRRTIDPLKDVDGISPNRMISPATPESKVRLAEHILGHPISELDPSTIGIIGNGPLVGGPLVKEVLPARGVDIEKLGLAFGTRQEIEEGVPRLAEYDQLRVIFTAVPVGALLRPEHIHDNTIVIDAGYGINPENGKPCGNASPELLALSGLRGIVVTAFRGGVGPVTAAVVYDRTIPRHEDAVSERKLTGMAA